MSMIVYNSLGDLEVDYEKKEVRACGQVVGFCQISHYVFERVKTEWSDSDLEDSDMRQHVTYDYETMRVYGTCEETPDISPEAERIAALLNEVGLILWCHDVNDEQKQFSLGFSQKDAFEARRKLKPLIKYLRETNEG